MGSFIPALEQNGYIDASKKILEIEKSEQHHGISLAITATCCIKAAGGVELSTNLNKDIQKTARLFAGLENGENALIEKAIALAQPCVDLFYARSQCTPAEAQYFLGVTYGVERLANKNIIPGEVRAFVRSGFYNLTLEQTEMGYLREHVEECDGAEGWHEAYMKHIIDELGDQSAYEGVLAIEQRTSDWYQNLYQFIVSL